MTSIAEVCQFLDQFAPPALAEEWDNVGLLVGRRSAEVESIMTCLTVTPDSVSEAIAEKADLIVSHHPFPFHPLKRLTDDSTVGAMLLDLIHHSIQIYSPHTAFDSTRAGINRRLADQLGLLDVSPLEPHEKDPEIGAGRYGRLPAPTRLADLAVLLGDRLRISGLHVVGDDDREINRVAVACGSAGQFLATAIRAECDLLVTGETSFHTCLEAEAKDVALLLPGHYASERFAVEELANELGSQFPGLGVWCSRRERDPLRWVAPETKRAL